ncbi:MULTISPECIES: hypothetical protein [Flavobacterium]|uniref:Uncharacterized protein n=2 Tax=Flavobacterium TaxID=237 RepID=A0AA94EZB5_9FLAO|nr:MULTISPECIES: hypothetical protein [Flavobacterium]OXA83128.1 hypothetical protein B0A56_02625 [Flavobacterium columnare NBRC 100251 = ATCC 23463]AMA48915.1 hypothetical protein AWN65_05260 [Flavobacterium covae]AND64953.1 hypothetical protein AX766_11455 [Flavobacterium covae]MCH4830883.1 hypothetical protein [Flavobacterium columnare]MCH4833177.1 hypothetical protein [Flavobacterium columnare]
MILNFFLFLIALVESISIITFLVSIILIIFYREEPYKTMAKKMLLYSIISFIIGFGSCVGGIVLLN